MVTTGLDVLLDDHLDELRNARVGILANHASVTSDLTHISDALHVVGVNIVALFGPEHGARGDVADGEHVGDSVDQWLGVPVHSLYGAARVPSSEVLSGIDVMIIDLQDVGARFYTFLYTMADVMRACGDSGVRVWVPDRPNPISGLNADGPVLEPEFASGVGRFAIPMRHGMTVGELARLFRARFGAECDLKVIPMRGWSRDMWYDQTGLPWVMPSPNMPSLDTATVFPGLCLIEGTNVSEGRGTVRPFETFGAPWVDARKLRNVLVEEKLPGVTFREAFFTPSTSKWQGQRCAGIQVYVTDRDLFSAPLVGTAVTSALRRLFPDDFEFRAPAADGRCFYDLLSGTSGIRDGIERGDSPHDIASTWRPGLAEFEQVAAEFRLY
jgi:uncharacterized protein YbbC (DUF1343 family)